MSTKKNSRRRRRLTRRGMTFLLVIVALLGFMGIKAIAAIPSKNLYYNLSTPIEEESPTVEDTLVTNTASDSKIVDKSATVAVEESYVVNVTYEAACEAPVKTSYVAISRYPEITDEERLWLMAVVTAEVGETASEEGIKGVIASVLKRVEYYGTDVFTEISRKYQYSCYDPNRGEVICYMGIAREYIQSLKTSTTPNPILAIDGEPQSGQQVVERLDRLISETIQDGAPEIRSGLNSSAARMGGLPKDEDTMFFCSAEYYYNHYADQYPIHIEVESDRTVFFVYSW